MAQGSGTKKTQWSAKNNRRFTHGFSKSPTSRLTSSPAAMLWSCLRISFKLTFGYGRP
jgi:hypothetical protein